MSYPDHPAPDTLSDSEDYDAIIGSLIEKAAEGKRTLRWFVVLPDDVDVLTDPRGSEHGLLQTLGTVGTPHGMDFWTTPAGPDLGVSAELLDGGVLSIRRLPGKELLQIYSPSGWHDYHPDNSTRSA